MSANTFKVLSKGDSVPVGDWRIKEGFCISRTWTKDGDFSIFGFWGEGDIILAPPKDYDGFPLEIVCMSSLTVEQIDINLCSQELREKTLNLERLLRIIQIRPIGVRIYHLLKWFNERFGTQAQMTHEQIAATLNTTRVTVTRCLGTLENEGKIKRNKRKIIFIR
jgi:hypothetical protein